MKLLGHKNYGSIPHLLGSKLGPGDHHVHEGQHRICTEKVRDKHDIIIVQEKYDGSNVGIAKKNGAIFALTRSGYLANTSPYEQHHVFAKWVEQESKLFDALLNEGERIAGEWLYQAHGIEYILNEFPFVVFDLFRPDNTRFTWPEFDYRLSEHLITPRSHSFIGKPVSIEVALHLIEIDDYHPVLAKDKPEGCIYRVERKGKVDFLAKYVRVDHPTGKYLFGEYENNPVHNCGLSQILNK